MSSKLDKFDDSQSKSQYSSDSSLKFESAEYLSVSDLSQLLSVSEKTIRGWIYKGLIKPERIGPRLIRFQTKYIEQWISQRK